jgi:hypothetical protein
VKQAEEFPMTIEPAPQPITMLPYSLKLAGISVLLSILLIVITMLTKIELPSAIGMITLIAATAPVAQGFVTKNSRIMSKGERVSFATLGSIFSLLASLILSAAFLSFSGVELSLEMLNAVLGSLETPWRMLAAIFAAALAISWLVLYFCTGWMCKSAMKRLEKV